MVFVFGPKGKCTFKKVLALSSSDIYRKRNIWERKINVNKGKTSFEVGIKVLIFDLCATELVASY